MIVEFTSHLDNPQILHLCNTKVYSLHFYILICLTTLGEDIEDIIALESLQFDLATIKAATCNFSWDNKLGEGGFGEVYKVIYLNKNL